MSGDLQFQQVYHHASKLMYNLCLHYGLNPHDNQEVTQELFVKVYQHYYQYNKQVASLKTWIYRIAVNRCLDFIKAKQSKKRLDFLAPQLNTVTSLPLSQAVSVNYPGIAEENKESFQLLPGIIYALPDNQKTAIILTKIEDNKR